MFASMAQMKHTRYLSDREYWKTEGVEMRLQVDPA
jgi:hypothetical protein